VPLDKSEGILTAGGLRRFLIPAKESM
jgi:hypothetical protein